jgi:endonuclease/exonuclease/phosphatase family metal-dependent hydrolase
MRLLHWNVHMWRDVDDAPNHDSLIDLIRDARPDVVSLVEVDEPWGKPSGLERVAAQTGYSWLFVPAFEYGREEPTGGFGNALLSREPFRAAHQWQLLWPPLVYDGTEPSEPRAAVFARIDAAGVAWIGTTHLPRNDLRRKGEALRRLVRLADGLAGGWVLCGDFNVPAGDWMSASRTTRAVPDPPVATYPSSSPVEPIDYFIVPAGCPAHAEVIDAAGSDHLPVLLTMAEMGATNQGN